jgi:hypothetical protein
MIKKIALPFHTQSGRNESFPVCNHGLHSRFAWEGNDGVQMIRHEQAQTAMPDELVVIMRRRGKNAIADVGTAKQICSGRHAFDGDEKPTALCNPLRNGVGQFFTDGQIHAATVAKILKDDKVQGRARPTSGFLPKAATVLRFPPSAFRFSLDSCFVPALTCMKAK